ncbi:MAG: DUF1289 domain-containing protein [Alphaproteobacteria bacterium]|nr:DUF1289 domain-containing protein [Alphaproteobacteria bacterium]MBV9692653.1 DUF1289 domain-containing protein [Alphaproteobacteria bacterium]
MSDRLIQTPCVKVCEIDRTGGLCKGCGRSLDEIARWGSMSDAERARIMAALAQRMKLPGAAVDYTR